MANVWKALFLVGLAALFGPPLGCSGDDSNGDGAGGNPSDSGNTFATSACATCERGTCGSEIDACESDAECAAYLGCEGMCPVAANGDADPACRAACPKPSAGGASDKLDALEACRQTGAGAGCTECGRSADSGTGGSDAGDAGLCTMPGIVTQSCAPDPDDDPACFKCNVEKCCDSFDAVFNDPGPAMDLIDCWLGCAKEDHLCRDACFDQFPDGITGFAGYSVCTELNCSVECGTSPCPKCSFDSCGCEYATCMMDEACFRIYHCQGTCAPNDVTCGAQCPEKYPSGKELFNGYQTCMIQNCTLACT